MDLGLTDKVAVVTGANKGIGLAITMGARIRVDGFLATGDEEFEWALQMNFFTALRAIRAALGPMVEQGSRSIVTVASVNAFFQPDGATVDYGAANAAVVNLSKSLSQEFGPKGVRVNCVSPRQVSTDCAR
jgi:NAD(P)-dependent dehydrogenase (short-subunit alcohol dehydrogenase family)